MSGNLSRTWHRTATLMFGGLLGLTLPAAHTAQAQSTPAESRMTTDV